MPARPAANGWRQVKGGGLDERQTESLLKARQHLHMARANQAAAGGQEEFDIVDTSRNHLGSNFRFVFTLCILAFVGSLMLIKLNGEYIRPPNRSEEEKDEIRTQGEDVTAKYFESIGRKDREGMTAEQLRKEGRREKAKRMKAEQREVQEGYEKHRAQMESGECDADCRAQGKQIAILKDQISAQVITDYYEVFDITNDDGGIFTKSGLKEKRAKIEELIDKNDPSVEHLDLVEVKEAYDTLQNNEARMYYNLYGAKPPERMRGDAALARNGGWAIDFALTSWRTKKALAWLRYFDDIRIEFALFVIVVGIPMVLNLRSLIRNARRAFPQIYGDQDEHDMKMASLRKATFNRRGGRRM